MSTIITIYSANSAIGRKTYKQIENSESATSTTLIIEAGDLPRIGEYLIKKFESCQAAQDAILLLYACTSPVVVEDVGCSIRKSQARTQECRQQDVPLWCLPPGLLILRTAMIVPSLTSTILQLLPGFGTWLMFITDHCHSFLFASSGGVHPLYIPCSQEVQ